jgi:UDP-hydrolysing UDP-N-acetyl-D-glucosamine 2-epimerase
MTHIHFVTLSRSDYSSIKPVLAAALNDKRFKVEVTAGGSHLLKRFGHTIDLIKADGIPIDHTTPFLMENDTTVEDISAAYGRAIKSFHDIFSTAAEKPDYVFVLGDRWEMQAAAMMANLLRLSIAHHSGGDITEGSADNQTRYQISRLAHLHFTALPEHTRRLLAMGEEEWRVHTVGEPALSQLHQGTDDDAFYEAVGLAPATPFALATFHPTTFDDVPFDTQIDIFLSALDRIDHHIILTAPNPDPESLNFYNRCVSYANQSEGRVVFFENLGNRHYYTAMSKAEFMIGNSSSGLWEAPSFKLPVINMGRRQDGRIRSTNVIDVDLNPRQITKAIGTVGGAPFKKALKDCTNPYVMEGGIQNMLDVMDQSAQTERLLVKKFIDPLKKDA